MIWKDIKDYDGFQVSNTGEVRSKDMTEIINNRWGGQSVRVKVGRVRKQHVCSGNEYLSVTLGKKRMYAHRLVADAFVPKIEGKDYINHIDGNKLNNKAQNLEWCTRSENMHHALATGLSSAKGGSHYSAIKVIDISTGKVYDTIKEAALAIGISNSYAKNMLCGRQRNKTSLKYLDL